MTNHCQIAQTYHDAVTRFRAMTDQHVALVEANKELYSDYYDRIADLPAQVQSEFYSDHLAAVNRIEHNSIRLSEFRDSELPDIRIRAMLDKISDIAAPIHEEDMLAIGQRAVSDFTEFQRWRSEQLDGVDVDHLGVLIDRGHLQKGRNAPLSDLLFHSWAKVSGVKPAQAFKLVQEHVNEVRNSIPLVERAIHALERKNLSLVYEFLSTLPDNDSSEAWSALAHNDFPRVREILQEHLTDSPAPSPQFRPR